jgi:hypothetical protein
MSRDRRIQLVALLVMLTATVASGSLLPGIIEKSDRYALRYTDVSVAGAPPFVALGTAIGALRGIIVDFYWIKVNIMKERGLFYEVMADAEIITKLQPRFAAVWAFHGHNMAYNISVATHTPQERWEWVNAGIRLVRNEGIRYNPNDLQLHRELAFWFAHKIEGVADDAHLFYKTEFCREWHYVLGEPPDEWGYDEALGHGVGERVEWIKAIADAPGNLEEAEARTPGVKSLVDELTVLFEQYGQTFAVDRNLLFAYAEWESIHHQSALAQVMGKAEEYRDKRPFFRAFDEIAGDPQQVDAWNTLILLTRKRVLLDEYNMDPHVMYEYTRDLGPIDWRNGQAHALYWSRRGTELGEQRIADPDDVYKVLNNDRVQLQAMQGLARFGRMYFDPFSNELPARFPDPRWIDSIDSEFEKAYVKHYDARGGGPESFIGFFQNFLASSVREWYRAGEREKAQKLMDRLNELFGTEQSEAIGKNPRYRLPLDVFVWEETKDEYEFQPHISVSDVAASLRYGLVQGLGRGDPDLMRQTQQFASKVTAYFQGNEYNNYVNKFGRGRMFELVNGLEDSLRVVFIQVMLDRSIPLPQRVTIWRRIDEIDKTIRGWAYDRVAPAIERELESSGWGKQYTVDPAAPEPRRDSAHRGQDAGGARAA